ncbi:MAG: formylmethanofuran dehydrogenase subunit E family protein [Bacteroidota bacterium]
MTITTILVLAVALAPADTIPADSLARSRHRHEVLWEVMPVDPKLMQADVKPLADSIIRRHGQAEWTAGVLTNELHRHLGVYNIIGVKMGVRAMELLNVGFDEMRVECEAGYDQPLSCIHDGLQVATGASLGRGLYRVADGSPTPRARFTARGQTVELTLRPDVVQSLTREIATLSRDYGFGSARYFRAIRSLSMRRWLEFDRVAIFDERTLP